MITVTLPLHVVSEANRRDHWRVVRKRLGEHKAIAHMRLAPIVGAVRFMMESPEQTTLRVTLTRLAERTLDSDNLAGGCKGCRDGVALALGIDDGDPRVTWIYAQRKQPRKLGYAVEIKIEAGS